MWCVVQRIALFRLNDLLTPVPLVIGGPNSLGIRGGGRGMRPIGRSRRYGNWWKEGVAMRSYHIGVGIGYINYCSYITVRAVHMDGGFRWGNGGEQVETNS